MRSSLRRRFAAGLLVSVCSVSASAAEPAPATDERLNLFEKRLNQLEEKYQVELRKRDQEIAQLKAQLSQQPPATTRADEDAAWTAKARINEVDRITSDVLRDITDRRQRGEIARTPASLLPDIAVAADFVANVSSRRIDKTRNRADVREVELDLRAAVDPRADAVVVLAFERDAAPGLFGGGHGEHGHDEESVPDNHVNIEEAYLFFHDFGVPNLTAKVGRYHVRFGRQNMLHLHDLPTVDPPFVNQAFLAPEALVDSGFSLSYLVPNPWNQYFEAILEINSGEGAGSESPTLRGDAGARSPSVNTHLLWNRDLAKGLNLELGASGLWAPSENDDEGHKDVQIYGADITLVRRDPTGGFNNSLLQAEAMYAHTMQHDGSRINSWGAYALGQQQLNKDWYAGLRLDYTQDPNDSNNTIWGVSPYVSWYWSENLRFRMQYQARGGDVPSEHLLFFQLTWIFGSHPPHPYWSMK